MLLHINSEHFLTKSPRAEAAVDQQPRHQKGVAQLIVLSQPIICHCRELVSESAMLTSDLADMDS
jgi:hypothetical protein